jgi:hypothetical protein
MTPITMPILEYYLFKGKACPSGSSAFLAHLAQEKQLLLKKKTV